MHSRTYHLRPVAVIFWIFIRNVYRVLIEIFQYNQSKGESSSCSVSGIGCDSTMGSIIGLGGYIFSSRSDTAAGTSSPFSYSFSLLNLFVFSSRPSRSSLSMNSSSCFFSSKLVF